MPATAAGTYGMSDTDLQSIIQKTANAIDQMDQLGRSVMSNTDAVGAANVSTSGSVITGNLATWTDDFNTVRGLLTELNGKAQNLYQINVEAASNAQAAANR
jgi:hypothetical protein